MKAEAETAGLVGFLEDLFTTHSMGQWGVGVLLLTSAGGLSHPGGCASIK